MTTCLQCDRDTNILIGQFPAFEEEPRYTPNGRPWKNAVSTGCPYAAGSVDLSESEFARVHIGDAAQADFVLGQWLVSFVTEGTPVETQEVAPGGKVFTAWYEDADDTQPVFRLSTVDRQLTLDINVDGGFLWLDMSVLFKAKAIV